MLKAITCHVFQSVSSSVNFYRSSFSQVSLPPGYSSSSNAIRDRAIGATLRNHTASRVNDFPPARNAAQMQNANIVALSASILLR
jgi:hypothetical protein